MDRQKIQHLASAVLYKYKVIHSNISQQQQSKLHKQIISKIKDYLKEIQDNIIYLKKQIKPVESVYEDKLVQYFILKKRQEEHLNMVDMKEVGIFICYNTPPELIFKAIKTLCLVMANKDIVRNCIYNDTRWYECKMILKSRMGDLVGFLDSINPHDISHPRQYLRIRQSFQQISENEFQKLKRCSYTAFYLFKWVQQMLLLIKGAKQFRQFLPLYQPLRSKLLNLKWLQTDFFGICLQYCNLKESKQIADIVISSIAIDNSKHSKLQYSQKIISKFKQSLLSK